VDIVIVIFFIITITTRLAPHLTPSTFRSRQTQLK
jgi:hypothetical protein